MQSLFSIFRRYIDIVRRNCKNTSKSNESFQGKYLGQDSVLPEDELEIIRLAAANEASAQRSDKSAPTKPCVTEARCSTCLVSRR